MRMLTQKIWIMLLALITFTACEKEIDKYYERPKFLKGNAYEFMQDRGNFKLFIQAAELSGYLDILKGRGLCTVMAPNDDAFKAWMTKNNYATLEAVPLNDLKALIGFHMIQNSYEEDYMLGFHHDGEWGVVGDGTDYKFKTYAVAAPRMMTNPITKRNVNTVSGQKYAPVFSTRLFKTKKCTDFAGNYKYFFPDVNWQGDDEKLHMCNAAVIEAGLPTDNGYIYILDKVADPLRTLYQTIEAPEHNQYSSFLKMYDRFAEVSQKSAINGDTLYNYHHFRSAKKAKAISYTEQLPNLASEWAYHGEQNGAAPYYFKYMRYTYNCFTPSNTAINDFFQSYFQGFSSIEDLPQLTLYYFLKPYVKEGEGILLPETFEKDGVKGDMGEKWSITRSDIKNHEFCANGIFYGIDQVFTPMVFNIVTKPLFSTSDFAIMANMYFKADQFVTLTDPTPDRFTIFILADTTLTEQYNVGIDFGNDYFNDEAEKITIDNTAQTPAQIQDFVESQIIFGAVRDLNKRAYYATKVPYTYVYTEAGNVYGENGAMVQILNKWETVNGLAYQVDSKFSKNTTGVIATLKNQYKDFYDMLVKAKLIITKDKVDIFSELNTGERSIIFAPVNGTLDKTALSALSEAALKAYLNYFIVSQDVNMFSDYILPGYGTPKVVKTMQVDEEKTTIYQKFYNEMSIETSGNSLSLTNKAGNKTILTNGEVPFFATDGLIYGVTDVIQSK